MNLRWKFNRIAKMCVFVDLELLELEQHKRIIDLEDETRDAFETFLKQFEDHATSKQMSYEQKLDFLKKCLLNSKFEKWKQAAEKISSYQCLSSALLKVNSISKNDTLDYLEEITANMVKKVSNHPSYKDDGYFLNGLAFPVLFEIKDSGYLPVFLTCAHCVKKKDEEWYKPEILLTPRSLKRDEAFTFQINPEEIQKGVFGCNAEASEKVDSLDFFICFLKGMKNGNGEEMKRFWVIEDLVENKQDIKVFMTPTYDVTKRSCPLVQEGLVENFPVPVKKSCAGKEEEEINWLTSIAIHDLTGVHRMSGECIYVVDEDGKLKALLVFRGRVNDTLWLGVPLVSIRKFLEEKHGDDLKDFCYQTIPNNWETSVEPRAIFVESYLLLLKNNGVDVKNVDTQDSEKGNATDPA